MLNIHTQNRRGFTLTELAIVLGIIGSIVGAIWAAASAVKQKNAITRAESQIGYIVTKMQSIAAINPSALYVAQDGGCVGGTSTITGNSLTSNATAGIFPQEMISGTLASPKISSPWGQNDIGLIVNAQSNSCAVNAGGGSPGDPGYIAPSLNYSGSFALTYLSIPVSACGQILLAKGVDFATMGFTQACVDASGSNGCTYPIAVSSTSPGSQLTESAIKRACTMNGNLSSTDRVSFQLTFSTTTP